MFEFKKNFFSGTGNKKSRIIVKLLMAFGAIAIVYAFMASPKEEISESRLGGISLPENTIQGGKPVTEEYRNALKQADIQRIEAARNTGVSALPTIVNSTDSQPGLPMLIEKVEEVEATEEEETPTEKEVEESNKPIAPTLPIAKPDKVQTSKTKEFVDRDKAERLANYMKSLPLTSVRPVSATIFMHEGVAGLESRLSNRQSAAESDLEGVASNQLPVAGTVLFGHLLGRVSSDSQGPVLAEILQGEYSGTRLIGRFETSRNSTHIQFSQMTIGLDSNESSNGNTFSINAVAVDTKHIGISIPTEIDRHLAQNLATGFVSGFASGLGKTLTHFGGTSTVSSDGSVTTTTERLNLRNSLFSATGQAVANTGAFLSEAYGNRPPTFVVEAGTPIGILFL